LYRSSQYPDLQKPFLIEQLSDQVLANCYDWPFYYHKNFLKQQTGYYEKENRKKTNLKQNKNCRFKQRSPAGIGWEVCRLR
jgi:hypothetical protein